MSSSLSEQIVVPTRRGIAAVEDWMLIHKNALAGLAVTRILVGIAMFGVLAANFPARHILWGPGSTWAEPFRDASDFQILFFLFEGESTGLFTVKYLLLMGVAVGVIIGWRTRTMTLILALGMAALVERASPTGDQGDNIARIGLMLMVLMNTSAYWSLDARRRARGSARGAVTVWQKIRYGLPVFPAWTTTVIHNGALVALACQIFILYTASALFKVQGSTWQAGTALYYPLSTHEYGVFPWLNDLIVANPAVLTAVTYFSVYVQLFFAVALLHPVSRRLALVGMVLLHGGIAVLMGLPWFSLAMLAFDAIFVSNRTYRWLDNTLSQWLEPVRQRMPERLRWNPLESRTRVPAGQDNQDGSASDLTIAERRDRAYGRSDV